MRESIYLIVITPILMPLFTVPSITRLTMIVVMWWMKLKMKKPCDGNFFSHGSSANTVRDLEKKVLLFCLIKISK